MSYIGHAFFEASCLQTWKRIKKGIGRDFPRLVNGWFVCLIIELTNCFVYNPPCLEKIYGRALDL